jgi:hypothetical protein
VNTSQSEISPHLSVDGSTLYFSRGKNWGNVDSFDLWQAPVILAPPEGVFQAGDSDQNRSFDQLDLVRVLQAGKYLTGEPATWGDGDWDGAPGGSPGDPPGGDGLFDQLDIMAALTTGLYLAGPYAAFRPDVATNDANDILAGIGCFASGDCQNAVELVHAPVPEPLALLLAVVAAFRNTRNMRSLAGAGSCDTNRNPAAAISCLTVSTGILR